jgi:4-hydroxybenzoate polyprenyltransferase
MSQIDILLSVGSLILSISLIPQIIYSIKLKQVNISNITCFMSIFGLSIILSVYISMNLVFSSIITGLTLLCWSILTIMKKLFELNKIFER